MTKHYSDLIANISSQSANDTLKNALKESGKSGGYYITKEAKNNFIFVEERLFYVVPFWALWSGRLCLPHAARRSGRLHEVTVISYSVRFRFVTYSHCETMTASARLCSLLKKLV